MANRITSPPALSKKGNRRRPAGSQKKTTAQLVAEIRQLRKDMRALKKERDSFRQYAYACARKELTWEETEELIKNFKDGLELKDFIHELFPR